MTERFNHSNYTAADIERYWKGELTPQEQHAMEMAALADPFLADAMEGYADAQNHEEKLQTRLDDLSRELNKRINRKDRKAVLATGWWRAAALVAVVGGAAWLIVALNRNNSKDELARNEAKKMSPATIAKPGSSPQTSKDSVTAEVAETVSSGRAQGSLPVRKPAAKTTSQIKEEPAAALVSADRKDDETVRREETVSAKNAEADKKQAAPSAVVIGNSPATELNQAGGSPSTSAYEVRPKSANRFSASVVDMANKPIPNVNVSIPAFNVETKTDKQGYFSFFANDSVVTMNVSSGGYLPQFVNLNRKATLNQIVLNPYPKDKEGISVVADGKGIPVTDSGKHITLHVMDAEPVTGFAAFQDYLAKNKRIPFGKKEMHGAVIVSFDVYPRYLANFEIEESLDEELDEEAIRLIKAGPGWKLLKGKKAPIKLTIQF